MILLSYFFILSVFTTDVCYLEDSGLALSPTTTTVATTTTTIATTTTISKSFTTSAFGRIQCLVLEDLSQLRKRAHKVRWAKVLSFSSISYSRAHYNQGKITAVQCDPSYCEYCLPIGRIIDIFPDYTKCHRFTIGQTYLFATDDWDNIISAPVEIQAQHWLNISQHCAFSDEPVKCRHSDQCSNASFSTLMSSTTYNHSEFDCTSATSSSFQQRIQIAGAASVFIYEGNSWNPGYGVEDVRYLSMSMKSCGISRECQQMLQVDASNSERFGNATNFANPTNLHILLQSKCFEVIDKRGVYLVFHEPIPLDASPYYRVIWSRAKPVQLNSSLWLQLKQLCYFNMNENCLVDFTLPATSSLWNSEESA